MVLEETSRVRFQVHFLDSKKN